MKEKLYTIPLMDAFKAEDECPFCFVERQLEQHAMDFVLGAGASYMEDDVRAETDKMGFCRTHYKKMYDYGNRLGAGLILKTHFQYKTKELHEQIRIFAPSRASVFSRFKKGNTDTEIREIQNDSRKVYKDTYARYLDTFFELFKKNQEFLSLFETCKGFCIPHFGDLVETAESALSDKEKKAFYTILFPMMEQNMQRLLMIWTGSAISLITAIKMRTGVLPRMHCRVECRKRQEDIRQMSHILWTSKTKQAPARCLRK